MMSNSDIYTFMLENWEKTELALRTWELFNLDKPVLVYHHNTKKFIRRTTDAVISLNMEVARL
jgi:hypothetical protein